MHAGGNIRFTQTPRITEYSNVYHNIIRAHSSFLRVLALLAVLLYAVPAVSLDYMPLEEIRAGMTGYGKTVFEGEKIVRFPVKVRGVIPGAGLSGEPLILVELTGREVKKYGGVAMGMSGSPIYIKDRLIGALSLAFPMSDHSLAGVTHASAMLAVAEYDVERGARRIPIEEPIRVGSREYRWIQYGGEPTEDANALTARPALAPVAVRGLSARSYKIMKKLFEDSGVEMMPLAGLKTGASADQIIGPGSAIKPGSSVAVQLVRGDIDFSAVGTVTSVEDGQVLLFGHPFFRKGDVGYLLADAYVHAIISSMDVPYKMASTGLVRGKVVQDRGSALVGKLDSYPQMIPVVVTVVDSDTGKEKTTSVKIIRDGDFLGSLILMVVLESLDNAIDRVGAGTSHVSFSLTATGYDGEVERENTFHDRRDVSVRSLSELAGALVLFSENRFIESVVTGLKIRVTINSSDSTARIEKVAITDAQPPHRPPEQETPLENNIVDAGEAKHEKTPAGKATGEISIAFADSESEAVKAASAEKKKQDKKDTPTVTRGSKLKLSVRLRPYRQGTIEESIFLKVPRDATLGKAVIKVSSGMQDMPSSMLGGALIDVGAETPEEREQTGTLEEEDDGSEDFEGMITDFLERDMNNELVANILPMGLIADGSMDGDAIEKDGEKTIGGKAKKITDWVLRGAATLKVRIVDEAGASEKTRNVIKSKISTLRVE